MDWVADLIPRRLYVGPAPRTEQHAQHVREELGVTHIFNLKAHTDTKYGAHNAASAYMRHWKEHAPTLTRLPVPADLNTRSDKLRLQWYASAAHQVAEALREAPNAVAYVHARSGCEEEAIVAFTVWAELEPRDAPRDVNAWCSRTNNELLLDSEEWRGLTAQCMKQARASQTNLLTTFIRKKRVKK